MPYRCLLFDLDGTLVDSRADLTTAVNLMLRETGLGPLAGERVVGFVGEGAARLVRRALGAAHGREPSDREVAAGLESFGRHYREHLLDATRAYEGVPETLKHFGRLPKGVVTNKPFEFTEIILDGLGLRRHFEVVFGGDSLPERKPSGVPLVEAARLCGTVPAECLMVGDSVVDVRAGRAARTGTCGFVGGFGGREELLAAGADHLIERFYELRGVVERASGSGVRGLGRGPYPP